MTFSNTKARHGFFEPDLLVVIAVLAILVAVGLPIIAKHRDYWWVVVLVALAIWFAVLYGLGFFRPSIFRPRPPVQDESKKDDHVA
jgi:hypothetical protein